MLRWTPAIAVAALLLAGSPRTAAACDPNCDETERGGLLLVAGIPTTVVAGFLVPAVAARMDRQPPDRGSAVVVAMVGGVVGCLAAWLVHSGQTADGGHIGAERAVGVFIGLPFAGAMVSTAILHLEHDKPRSPPPTAVMLAPAPGGALVSWAGSF